MLSLEICEGEILRAGSQTAMWCASVRGIERGGGCNLDGEGEERPLIEGRELP